MTATWTAPRTWTAGELVTASIMNTHVRDNLSWLKTPTESGVITFSSDFTTSSSSYVDVTSVTTTITTNGGGLDVNFRAMVTNDNPAITYFQFVVDGSTNYPIGGLKSSSATNSLFEGSKHIPALSAGSHTIKLQAKSGGGTSTVRGTSSAVGDPEFFVREAGN